MVAPDSGAGAHIWPTTAVTPVVGFYLGDHTVTRAPTCGPASQRRGRRRRPRKNTVISPLFASSESRALDRVIGAGSAVHCAHCGTLVRFAARARGRQVIANVYVDGRWARVEHFHP